MKGRVGVLMTVGGTVLLILSTVLSTVAFASNGRGVPSGPGADVKYGPPQQGSCTDYQQCDDGDPCNHDICNNGTCEHSAIPGCRTCTTDANCADADPCTTNEACYDGLCLHTVSAGCRACGSAADCYDGDCDGYDFCSDGFCTEAAPQQCRDAYACTRDVCQQGPPGSMTCRYVRDDSRCSPPDACWEGECACDSQYCPPGADANGCVYDEVTCDDSNPCTSDTCDPADFDGDPCTHTDIVCDDGNPCSEDSCDAWSGDCIYEFPDEYECSNCDSCPCTGGYCVYDYGAETWECVAEPCDDGVACTIDWCSEEGCEHEDDCDDGMACSIDWCDEEEGCQHDYRPCGECTSGVIRVCGTDVGDCSTGYQSCIDGWWGACVGGFGPGAEVCDGRDNDCDGPADEGDVCAAVMLGSPEVPEVLEVEELPSTGAMPLLSGLSVSSMALASLALIGGGLLLRRRS